MKRLFLINQTLNVNFRAPYFAINCDLSEMKVDNLENKTAVLKVKVDHTRFQNVVDLRNSFQINLLINQDIIGQISKKKKHP